MADTQIVHTAAIDRDVVLIHPSQLSNLKKSVLKELHKKKNKWNDEVKGVITQVSKIQILNGGRGKLVDVETHLHYQVRYEIQFIKPQVGQSIKAKVVEVY